MAITLPHEAMVQLFAATPDNDLPDTPNHNVCPTVQIHTIISGTSGTSGNGNRRLRPMRWGFLPRWYEKPGGGPLLINARAETIAQKPAFRSSVQTRRCLIVASGFYEWTVAEDKARLPWYITRTDAAPLVMAGIWRDWQGPGGETLTTCAVVTTGANAFMSRIHHRMPVILTADDWPLWLGEAGPGAAPLMRAAPEDALRFHRVDRAVNSNRAAGPELIEPIDAAS